VNLHDRTHSDGSRSRLFLALQTRAVFSSDLTRLDHRGYVFEPMLRYRQYDWLMPGLDTTISLRPLWATGKLHGYFYDVEPQFASVNRPVYEAEGGYFGTGLNFYASYRLNDKASVFFGLQTTSHHGAENRDSPLHEKDFTVGLGAGFIWKLIASKRMVTIP
jgi:MipA family protein